MTGRIVPDNCVDAEQALIGAGLTQPDCLDLIPYLEPRHFFDTGHRRMFAALRALREEQLFPDVVLVAEKLRAEGALVDAGGVPGIAKILAESPAIASPVPHAKNIIQAWLVRRIAQEASELATTAMSVRGNRDAVIARVGEMVERLQLPELGTAGMPIGQLVDSVMARLEKGEESRRGLRTGFTRLDHRTGGMGAGDLWVLAARPGVGKTALAANIAVNVAFGGGGVQFFSLEMPRDQIAERIASAEARVPHDAVRSGALDPGQRRALAEAAGRLSKLSLFVDDAKNLTIADIQARALERKRELAAKGGALALVVVDYLQLIRTRESKSLTREQAVAEVSKALKALAGILGVPVLALAQLNRSSEVQQRPPRPSDLRETGQIEQDADVILFLWRGKRTPRGCVDVVIAKQRNGPVGIVPLVFWSRHVRFYDAKEGTDQDGVPLEDDE